MTTYGVTPLYGGLDSATVTTYATGPVDHLTAITFQYGQSHAKEIECAKKINRLLSIKHQLLDISLLNDVSWYSALTKSEIVQMSVDLKVPLNFTWSCYRDGESPCREGDSCILRTNGFEQAGIVDPLIQKLQKSIIY